MDLETSQDQLGHKISVLIRQSIDARQIAGRMKQLLPNRLNELRMQYLRSGKKSALAQRYAMMDEGYMTHVTQYLEVAERWRMAQVEWQTHLMLYELRRSKL